MERPNLNSKNDDLGILSLIDINWDDYNISEMSFEDDENETRKLKHLQQF